MKQTNNGKEIPRVAQMERAQHGRIVDVPDESRCLNTDQLTRLEQSFRDWAEDTTRRDVRLSRRRVLLIFLLIRYTGAKLNEVLSLDPLRDIDPNRHLVIYGKTQTPTDRDTRKVQLSEALAGEIETLLDDARVSSHTNFFAVDPGFLRRKFYERTENCGFPKRLGAPEMIRKSRGVELLHNNMPLPAVQMLLGHSTPNRTVSYVAFSEEEIQRLTKRFLERESTRNTSARNVFWGKIQTIRKGDIQSLVRLVTIGGHQVTTMITNDSLERLALQEGKVFAAEVKAPWVILQKGANASESSAENRFQGVITRITSGKVATEYVIRTADGTEICSVVSDESNRRLGLREKDLVWALFNSSAVVLHTDE
ncbi:MAG: transporter [Desulfobulbaceae bacterium DB1]|nr:MAG: transporter [Desulfobulbaceae bacterium DB1]